jgi:membrane-bound lytic murein transglycosylase MltF
MTVHVVRQRLSLARLGTLLLAGLMGFAQPSLLAQTTGAAASGAASAAPSLAASAPPQRRQLSTTGKVWKGDLDKMIERRMVRVLVPHSRTLFYIDKGQERGISAETARDFERFLNAKYKAQLGKRPLTVYLIATTRDELIEGVVAGHGDIGIGNLTVTEQRQTLADFVAPQGQKGNTELVLNRQGAPALVSADALSGKTVHVRQSSSYFQSLQALNAQFATQGKPKVVIELVPDELEDEDLMEMLNAGLVQHIVVDDWKARVWAQVLPKIRVNDQAVVRAGGRVGWAIRKDSPKLAADINEFYQNVIRKQGLQQYRLKQAMSRVKQISNNGGDAEYKRFEQTLVLFKKYGAQYNFDPLMLAAQGYQESRLDQGAKSHVGAIGVMQIMPATGAELKVGDIRITEPNIHGGTKYMDKLMTKYFQDAKFSDGNRPLFAFAAYNAGPGNISKMRKEAAKRGLDPDKWFNNVEVVTSEKIGIETTTYVRNIYKYYVSYGLLVKSEEARRAAREAVSSGRK